MNIYSRSLILAAMTAVSLTQGCSCSSDDDPEPPVVVEPPPATPTLTMSGTASKGILSAVIVSACPIVAGTPNCTNPVASAVTGVSGKYTIKIPRDYVGKPLAFRATPSAETRMTCDLPQGCNAIPFGGSYTPDSNPNTGLRLDSFTDKVAQDAVVNITPLTSIATSLALEEIKAKNIVNDAAIGNEFKRASAQIVDRFGLQGDITQLPVIDITQENDVKTASLDALTYNAYNTAIVSALHKDKDANLTIEKVLNQFTSSFVTKGISDNPLTAAITPSTIGLNKILEQARTVLNTVTTRFPGTLTTLTPAITRIELAVTKANNKTPTDEGTKGTASESVLLSPIEKVKAFVKVLGDVGGTIDLVNIKKKDGSTATIGARADEFEDALQAAEMAASTGVEQVAEATALVVEAMANAYEAYDKNKALRSWTSPDGVAVAIMPKMKGDTTVVESVSLMVAGAKNNTGEYDATPVKVTVDGIESNVLVNMTGTEMHTHTNGEPDANGVETDTAKGDIMVKGTATSDTVKMTVYDTSKVSLGDSMSVHSEQAGVESTVATANTPKLMLKVMLEDKKGVSPSVSFSGMLELSLSMLKVTQTTDVSKETTVVTAGTLALKVWGEVKNASGDLTRLNLVANGDATGLNITEMVAGKVTTQTDSETANKYAPLSAAVNFNADVAGNIGVVSVSLDATRTGLEAVSGNVFVEWPGYKITVSAADDNNESTPQIITADNQDGVKAVFTKGANGKWTGNFSLAGMNYASFAGVTVTFTDNTFLSLDIFE